MSRAPLAGLRVLTVSQFGAGPFGTQVLADLGAPRFGVLREVASPIKTAGAIKTLAPAPGLGEHTDTLLSEPLHHPPERIAAFRAARVLGDADPEAPTSGSSAP